MIRGWFENRSGRIIAMCRAVLALVFFVALWLEPQQPVRSSAAGYVLLAAYLAISVAMLIVAWRSWWYDHLLAVPLYLIDAAVFLAAVYFTEGTPADFSSPFLAFFAFLMLAAAIRWDWRAAALAGTTLTTLYFIAGLAINAYGLEFDLYRFGRRTIYMFVLAFVMVWFGVHRREPRIERFGEMAPAPDSETEGMPLREAMRYAMAATGARRAVIAWSDSEEPWTEVVGEGLDAFPARRLPPEVFSEKDTREPGLYDSIKGRALIVGEGGELRKRQGPVSAPMAEMAGFQKVLAVPFRTALGEGELLLACIPGVSTDHAKLAHPIAREIEAAFDRAAMVELGRTAAVAHTRDSIARDLHDSVAQALAGASFRLEALRNWIRAGEDPEPEIAAIKQALRSEQQHVRGLIARLRAGGEPSGETNLAAILETLSADLSTQWGMAVKALVHEIPVQVPDWLGREVQQLAREAVANAVRHGGAKRVVFEVRRVDGEVGFAISDDGHGFPMDRATLKPWSLHERVKSLGGTMALRSDTGGTRIEINLPVEGER